MYQASAPLFRQGLTALAAILDKAVAQCAERKIDPAVLLADRLAPDMFPLTRQVQLSCDFAKNTMSRLAGREPPRFEDVETTVPELQERIARTLALVDGIQAAEIDGSEAPDDHAVDRWPEHELRGPALPAAASRCPISSSTSPPPT